MESGFKFVSTNTNLNLMTPQTKVPKVYWRVEEQRKKRALYFIDAQREQVRPHQQLLVL
jgi:hypothetical protein